MAPVAAGGRGDMGVRIAEPITVELVEALEERRARALLAADGAALGGLQHDHGVVVHSSGFVDGAAPYAEGLGSRSFEYRSLEVAERRITLIGDTAVVVQRQQADMVVQGVLRSSAVRCTVVWTRVGGEYGIALVQQTRLAD